MIHFWKRIRSIFSLDYRSLALMRIALAATIILDLIDRGRDLFTFYADGGILPRAVVLDTFSGSGWISLHLINGSWEFQLFLFCIAFIAACALLIGYRTTLAGIISWVLLISLQNRNPLVLQGGDVIFRTILFFGLFLPWGKYMSIDSVRKNIKLSSKTYFGIPSIAYTLQIFLFYFVAGMLKTGEQWTVIGTAVFETLHIDQLTTFIGEYLLHFPSLLVVLTFSVLILELLGPLFMLSPWKNGLIRTVIIFLFAFMQIGLNLSMHLGLFGMIAISVTLGFLPSWFWENIVSPLKQKFSRKNISFTIYYDHACGFCHTAAMTLSRLFWLPSGTQILASDVDLSIQKEMETKNSWIVITPDGMHHYYSDAMKYILRASPLFWWTSILWKIPYFEKGADKLYRQIAKKRIALCTEETPSKPTISLLKNSIVCCSMIYIVWINYASLSNIISMPQSLQAFGEITRLDQEWSMFAPFPLKDDGWYVMPGTLKNGAMIDIFRNGSPFTYEKPENVSALYKNQRWQKYMMNLWMERNKDYRLYFGKYACREWNKNHTDGGQLETFKMIFMYEPVPSEDSPETPAEPHVIWEHTCF